MYVILFLIVQTLDSAMQRIDHYPSGPGCSEVGESYPLDKSLSRGVQKQIVLSFGWLFIQWIALSTFRTTGAREVLQAKNVLSTG